MAVYNDYKKIRYIAEIPNINKMFHSKSQTLAEVMKENNREPPRHREKPQHNWHYIIDTILGDIVKKYGYEATQRHIRRIAKPQKVQITKIKFPASKNLTLK